MKISELHPSLKSPFKEKSGVGIIKGSDPKHPHIFFVVPPAPPVENDESRFSMAILSDAMNALHRLPAFDEMDDLDKLINYLFVRREALQSSRIEGTWSTIDSVLTPAGLIGLEEQDGTESVRGYAHALEDIFEKAYSQKEKIFSLQTVCHLHAEIMKKDSTYLGVPGKMRTPGSVGSIVYIGGLNRPEDSIYNPSPPEYVLSSLKRVMKWYSDKDFAAKGDAGVGMNLIMRIAIGHSHFEAVHPFSDGNGRVGRALWPLQMVASGLMPLYLSGYVEKEKRAYVLALELAQKKLDYSKLIDFISRAVISSSEEMKLTKDKILSLPDLWRKRGGFRKHSAAEKALLVMLKMPIFTLKDLSREVGCSAPAAASAINDLKKKRIIKERTGLRRNRIFAAEEVIVLLSRDFGSDIDLAMDKAMRVLTDNLN